MNTEPLPSVLVVEDSPEDFESTRRALSRAGLSNPLLHCTTGDEALAVLFPPAAVADKPSVAPGLILLDLKLPGTNGHEVLARVKSDPVLRKIPVVVLTTSRDRRDIDECYSAGANSYIQKPVDLPGFQRAMRSLREYWLDVVVLPAWS
jgi:CheY-like chemotaxis protein